MGNANRVVACYESQDRIFNSGMWKLTTKRWSDLTTAELCTPLIFFRACQTTSKTLAVI